MKTRLGLVVFILAVLMLLGCSSEVDRCSIPQEEMDNPPDDAVAYTIYNQSCITVSAIYITPKSCDWWGIDWTGMKVLHPNESYTVYVSPGRYALNVEDAFGLSFYDYRERIREGGEYVLANEDGTGLDECYASVTIDNQSDQSITGFYAYRNGGMNWLGDGEIAPGESFQFLMFPAIIDVKVTVGDFEEIYLEKDVVVDHHLTIEVSGD